MRILLLTQWFDPEPTLKGLEFAKALQHRGHHVEVLTGFPNYPGGTLYPGYHVRLRQTDVRDGIRVVRAPLYPSHNTSALGRVANYSSFALASALVGAFSFARPDVIYAYHPPATTALAALALGARFRAPFVLDVQDLWPDTLAATGMVNNTSVVRIAGRFCKMAYRGATRIVVLSPGFRDALVSRGVPPGKIDVIYNWCDETAIAAADPTAPILDEAGVHGRFNVVFAGTMGAAQGLTSVLQAARILEDRLPRVQFIFVGGGIAVDALKREAASLGLLHTRFLPVRSARDVAPLLAAADVLLVHLRNDPLFAITIPSKTQAYMAAGRPILMAVRGDAAQLVHDAGCGVCTPPEDPQALAAAVASLASLDPAELAAMGLRGRTYYKQTLSRDAGVQRFEAVLRSACAPA
jgi:colanic acid biosynthesis glycosyl transferase WcaI